MGKKHKKHYSIKTNSTQQSKCSPCVEIGIVGGSASSESAESNSPPQHQVVDIPDQKTNVLGQFPQQVYCPTCDQQVLSQTKYVSGVFTCALVFLLLFCCCCCGCCLVPLCLDACKDVEHRCSQCNTYIGTFERNMQCDGKGADVKSRGPAKSPNQTGNSSKKPKKSPSQPKTPQVKIVANCVVHQI
uniref:LITAF domain-containing protein n=1 Tax=Meloidogyne incognita TaxID=6306 RepID=A0A914L3X6_MELIC